MIEGVKNLYLHDLIYLKGLKGINPLINPLSLCEVLRLIIIFPLQI